MNGSPGSDVPVVLIVFNRPDCTARALERIRAARPRRLHVIADGPRKGRAGEVELVRSTRALVEQGVDWPCALRRDYADDNLGCARRVSSGLDGVFAQEETAIILEDDCVADGSFFPFCAELLARYRNDARVAQIGGASFQAGRPAGAPSYFFSRYPHCWGWATWRRAWRHYDHAMAGWNPAADAQWLEEVVDHPVERAIWARSFSGTAAGAIDSWAYRWTLAVWRQHALTALPYANLVSNIGFGPEATHTSRRTSLGSRPLQPVTFPLTHPAAVARDEEADEYTSRTVFRPPSLLTRLRRKLGLPVRP